MRTPAGGTVAPRRVLTTAALGTLTVLVAFTVPLAGYNPTVADLGAGPAGGTWVLSSMSVGLGAALLTAGRLADDYGRRRCFVVGCLLLAASSLAAALATDVVVFAVARVAAGVGGAAVVAAGLGMIAAAHPDPRDRARATGVWGASVGGGIAVGPLLGNYLASLHSWRDAHLVLLLAGVVLAVAGRGCPESRSDERARLDAPGVVLLSLGTTAALAGLTESRLGWAEPAVAVLLVTGSVLLVAFVVVERRSDHPMLDLALFRRPAFAAVNVAGLATGAGVIALMSYLAGFTGTALAIPATTAAWLLLAWSLPSVLTALAARRLPDAWTGRSRMAGALVVVGTGLLTLLAITPDSGPWAFVPGLLLAGVATGVLNAAMGRESVTSVPGRASLGSGANNTARYLGSALGVTLVSVVASPAGAATTSALVDGWHRAVWVTAAASVLGGLAVLALGGRAADSSAGTSTA